MCERKYKVRKGIAAGLDKSFSGAYLIVTARLHHDLLSIPWRRRLVKVIVIKLLTLDAMMPQMLGSWGNYPHPDVSVPMIE